VFGVTRILRKSLVIGGRVGNKFDNLCAGSGKDYGCNSSLDSFYVITEILRQSKVKYLTSVFQNRSDTATIKV
jgi:hypothetical protein